MLNPPNERFFAERIPEPESGICVRCNGRRVKARIAPTRTLLLPIPTAKTGPATAPE